MSDYTLETFDFIFSELTGSVSCIDQFGNYLFANKEFKNDFLKNKRSILGKKNKELFSKSTADILDSNNLRVFKLGVTQSFEEIQYLDGNRIQYWLSIKKPIFSYDGRIMFIVVFSYDITARKNLEAQLGLNFLDNDLARPITSYIYQSNYYLYLDEGSKTIDRNSYFFKKKISILEFIESFDKRYLLQYKTMVNLYKIIIHEFPGNIFWKSNDLKIKIFSKSLANMLKLNSTDEAISTTNYDYCDQKSAKALTDLDIDIITNKKTVVVEESTKLFFNWNLAEKFFLSKKRCVFNPIDNEYQLMGTALDFTLRKNVEINFRKALNKQFLEQEARDSFLANISHDIRTPITGMLGLIDDIKANSDKIPSIQNNVDTLKSITNEFLDLFNGILNTVDDNEANLSVSNKTVFNLIQEIESCLLLFRPIIDDKKVNIEYSVIEGTPNVFYANVVLLKRILINLIGNAIKFTPKGKIEVIVRYDNKQLYLNIKDTGIGISEDKIENIFNRLFKSSDKNLNHQGFGLGLYMVKKYVDALSGKIEVDSKLGIGTTFHLMLPIDVSNVEIKNSDVDIKANERISTDSQINSNTVLIIEDNQLAGVALRQMIESLGFDVTLVETGKEGIQIAKKEHFKCIFLDLGLPDQSGLDVLLTMREHYLTANTPIYVVSGQITKETHKSCLDAGANATFTKPMIKQQLETLFV
ncbi:MAG: ATP-binding protein [Pseudomonadota bacterium]|nr:ATP-binding protein [Pseudomonadota bacterium]